MVQRGKEWGKVVGKVVSHKSRTWFKEERKGRKYLYRLAIQHLRWSKRENNDKCSMHICNELIFCFGGQGCRVWAGLDLLRSHRERCLKITKLGPTQICSLVVCSLLQQTVHDHSTSVDAHGAGASTVPCNSLAVVNLRPCLVKNSLVPTCLVPGTKHGLEVIKWHAKRPCYP